MRNAPFDGACDGDDGLPGGTATRAADATIILEARRAARRRGAGSIARSEVRKRQRALAIARRGQRVVANLATL